jgi:hypothetical protein
VPASSLEVGVDYVFTLLLLRPSGENLAQDSITVRPRLIAPVASISGTRPSFSLPRRPMMISGTVHDVFAGGDRSMSLKSIFSINGIASYDPILGSSVRKLSFLCCSHLSQQWPALTYNWTICRGPTCANAANFADYFSGITLPGDDPRYLTINATALGEGSWTVCLTVARGQQPSAPTPDEYYGPSRPDCVSIFISADAPLYVPLFPLIWRY